MRRRVRGGAQTPRAGPERGAFAEAPALMQLVWRWLSRWLLSFLLVVHKAARSRGSMRDGAAVARAVVVGHEVLLLLGWRGPGSFRDGDNRLWWSRSLRRGHSESDRMPW